MTSSPLTASRGVSTITNRPGNNHGRKQSPTMRLAAVIPRVTLHRIAATLERHARRSDGRLFTREFVESDRIDVHVFPDVHECLIQAFFFGRALAPARRIHGYEWKPGGLHGRQISDANKLSHAAPDAMSWDAE